MAATNADPGIAADPAFAGLWRRVVAARWLIVAAAGIGLILFVSGAASLAGAAVAFGAILIAALLPRPSVSAAQAAVAGPLPLPAPEAGLRRFADALPDACFILDRRGTVRHANPRAANAFPLRVGDALTFRLRAPDLLAAFERVAKGGPPERVEFTERVPTERWFVAWFARLDAGEGSGDFVALIVEDISERLRVEKIRVDFVANASHELRTPLASLLGFIETLQGPAREDAAARERFLKIMREQAARMSRLVDDLLSLSRVEMRAHVRPSGEVDLVAVARQLADALEPLARENGVAIEAVLPDGPVIVAGDRDELTQVLANLIENACKYGRSGKRVVVTVTAPNGAAGAAVSVRDYGPGIAEEHIPRLTERFYRIDEDASRQHRGTGLGLAIAKHILARHHARLAIESRLGEGSIFTAAFPQERPDSATGGGEIPKYYQ